MSNTDNVRLNGSGFEQLIGELLESLGFVNVVKAPLTTDIGYDFQAYLPIKQPDGDIIHQLWLVEAKYLSRSRVSVNTIAQLSAILQVKETIMDYRFRTVR